MILLEKGQSNTVYLTLTERVTLTSPTYLFRFTNSTTLDEKAFIVADTSTYDYRHNKFTIIESSSEDLLNGTVSLTEGTWEYEVYEQSSTTNLDYSASTTLLERGKVVVAGTPQAYKEYLDADDTYVIYEG